MNIALLGFGTVGKEVALSLQNDSPHYHSHLTNITLSRIYTRSPHKIRASALNPQLITQTAEEIIEDPSIDCVVELMGGMEDALSLVRQALKAGKHVVTANKALLAHHGMELWQLARSTSSTLGFEASCGGGIPIIRTLTEGLAGDRINKVYGVLNGTCNFILSQMEQKKISFQEALAQAQAEGFAEADPTLDIGGLDAGHKICIMAGLSYNSRIAFEAIPIKGIENCDPFDINFSARLDYRIKLIAYSQILDTHAIVKATEAGIPDMCMNTKDTDVCTMLWTHPAILHTSHPMAHLRGSYNAVSVFSHKAGHTLYYGKGAGASPTASAILADLVALERESSPKVFEHSHLWPDINTAQNQVGMELLYCEWYLRFLVKDELGVLSAISKILANQGISIARALQEESIDKMGNTAILIIITHGSYYYHIQQALDTITTSPSMVYTPIAYPILEVPN